MAAAEYDALELLLSGKFVRDVEADLPAAGRCLRGQFKFGDVVLSDGACGGQRRSGDDLVPAMSFNATATSILGVNGIPVFCEVKDDTFCIDPETWNAVSRCDESDPCGSSGRHERRHGCYHVHRP